MNVTAANPCDALERPRSIQSVARGLSADEVRRLLAVVPDTVAGRSLPPDRLPPETTA